MGGRGLALALALTRAAAAAGGVRLRHVGLALELLDEQRWTKPVVLPRPGRHCVLRDNQA